MRGRPADRMRMQNAGDGPHRRGFRAHCGSHFRTTDASMTRSITERHVRRGRSRSSRQPDSTRTAHQGAPSPLRAASPAPGPSERVASCSASRARYALRDIPRERAMRSTLRRSPSSSVTSTFATPGRYPRYPVVVKTWEAHSRVGTIAIAFTADWTPGRTRTANNQTGPARVVRGVGDGREKAAVTCPIEGPGCVVRRRAEAALASVVRVFAPGVRYKA